MNSTFLDTLNKQQPFFDAILEVCQTRTMPVFMDLCWGDSFNINAAFHDPGIQFDRREKRLVLIRLHNEIRYFAGPNDPSLDDYPQEIGILPTEADALSFAYEYLVKRIPLSEIRVDRAVRSCTVS